MRTKKKNSKKPKNIQFSVNPENFINRDLSWLNFNRRVLSEASDSRTPLLERLRFLMIFTSNLDEFVMKRVGYIKHQMATGQVYRSIDGRSSQELYAKVREEILKDLKDRKKILKDILGELKQNQIEIIEYKNLSQEEKEYFKEYFKTKVFPILTPLSVDPGHPFPFISNLSLNLGLTLKHPHTSEILFSRVKIPEVLPGLLTIPLAFGSKYRFITTLSLVEENLNLLYPGMEVLQTIPFRVTRNADVDHREDEEEDLMVLVEEGIKERRLADCVRLEIHTSADNELKTFLKESLELIDEELYEIDHLLDLSSLKPILDLDLASLKHKPWSPVIPRAFAEMTNIFSLIKQGDVLLHHPYDSFSGTVEKFIAQAADDQSVLAIKMTLYRTGDNSPFIKSLIKAAEKGKQVVVLVELKARFDEERNIFWAQKLEDAGVNVVYGILGLKTHTKTALVIRQEVDGEIMSYAHIGTGNYHSQTSNIYTDLGLLTCKKQICNEVIEVFNYLTGSSLKTDYSELLVAPINMKTQFLAKIQNEIKNKKDGLSSRIIAKMNSMEDETISEALYEASRAGVEITLIVRGFCSLRPGVPGLSENIRVISIIGRFLEHSRIFYFANGSKKLNEGEFYIGSADWMHRNLHNRVELVTPIHDQKLKDEIWDYLQIQMNDNRQAWVMDGKGDYLQLSPKKDEEEKGTHMMMMKKTLQKEKGSL